MCTLEPISLPLGKHIGRQDVLLIGGYGIGNYGDEAILSGLLYALPQNVKKIVVSHDPRETSWLHCVDSIHPIEVLSALRKVKVIIISGGLFGRNMGLFGKLIPPFTLFSKSLQVNSIYYGLGVYPNTPKFLHPLIRASIRTAVDVSVRDKLSKRTLKEIGVGKVHLVQDLSFRVPSAPEDRAIEILKAEAVDLSKEIIGISLTRVNLALSMKVTPEIRKLIRRLGEKWEILMLPMCRHKKSARNNDFLYSKEVARGFPAVKFLQGTYHPSEILSIFGLLKVSICMRLHSMIFGWRMGVNMIPIPYDEKCKEFLLDVGIKPAKPKQDEILRRIDKS